MMKSLSIIFCAILTAFCFMLPASFVRAQNTRTLSDSLPTTDVNSTETSGKGAFKIIVCDGPAALNDPAAHTVPDPSADGYKSGKKIIVPAGWKPDPNYVSCDFNGLMLQVQHLINIAMVLGVLAAIAGFCYMGYLFISGTESNRKKAYEIFPKLFWGFIIMLTAWFIVFQILSWLTGNSSFTSLLGKP